MELKLHDSFDDLVETGSDAASIFMNELGKEAKDTLKTADLVIAKGMAHYEYLSDKLNLLGKPVLFLLRAKCRPVASSLGVRVGDYVAKLASPEGLDL